MREAWMMMIKRAQLPVHLCTGKSFFESLANLIFQVRLIFERIVENTACRVQLYKINVNPIKPINVWIAKLLVIFHKVKIKMIALIKNHILILSP